MTDVDKENPLRLLVFKSVLLDGTKPPTLKLLKADKSKDLWPNRAALSTGCWRAEVSSALLQKLRAPGAPVTSDRVAVAISPDVR